MLVSCLCVCVCARARVCVRLCAGPGHVPGKEQNRDVEQRRVAVVQIIRHEPAASGTHELTSSRVHGRRAGRCLGFNDAFLHGHA